MTPCDLLSSFGRLAERGASLRHKLVTRMPLSAGDKLGPYEILSAIGAGGMGAVYKARDLRLDRTVAVKVLPEHIAQREDLRARFEREARAVGSLNHPNICTLHDIGSQDGTGYMVMEFMEGETLAERIAKGAIPLEQALRFASQIADALDRAHRAGVTHRDVKPQNVILTRDGVKVLDFGLAKSNVSVGPTDATLTKVLTTEGTVMGTPQYMAPEQFEGKEADARADIWAFGAVLYEMVTGQKAFKGKSYASLLGAILSAEPAPMAVEPVTPGWLERLVRRCLAKDPEERYQSMRDVVLDLRTPPEAAPVVEAKKSGWLWPGVAAVSLLVGIVGGGVWMRGKGEAVGHAATFEVNPPAGGQFGPIVDGGGSAISPDGRTLAFSAINSKGEALLHLRQLQSREIRELTGTDGAARPFWSPDSKSIGFSAEGKLKRIDVAGGRPVVLCDQAGPRGGTWNEAGVILFGNAQGPLRRVSASGGLPVDVIPLDKVSNEQSHYYPQFLPGGKEFSYLVAYLNEATGERRAALFLASLDNPRGKMILETNHQAVYDASSGHLLYMLEPGILLAQKLELNPPKLVGEPIRVAEGVGVTTSNRYVNMSVSSNGSLFYGQRQGAGQKIQFGWRDRAGKLVEAIGLPLVARLFFDLSPDDRRLVYYGETKDGASDLWVMELANGLSTRMTFGGGRSAVWSPDGKYIYYWSTVGDKTVRTVVDGNEKTEILLQPVSSREGDPTAVSRDGNYLLVGSGNLMLLPLTGERKPKPFVNSKVFGGGAAFSPDGRWVAYSSDESGRQEIYVQSFPESGKRTLISAEGGFLPRWRADGKEIFWIRPGGMLMAASVELQGDGVKVGRAEELFVVSDAGGFFNFRPSRDGKRFLEMDLPKGSDPNPPMVVIQNWAARAGK